MNMKITSLRSRSTHLKKMNNFIMVCVLCCAFHPNIYASDGSELETKLLNYSKEQTHLKTLSQQTYLILMLFRKLQ